MSNFNKVFDENPNRKLHYNYPGYDGNKLVVGTIRLKNAKIRMQEPYNEYYVLVTYDSGELLPDGYVPISGYNNGDGKLFATINPNPYKYRMEDMCNYGHPGGIQRVSRIDFGKQDWDNADINYLVTIPEYLLGPGPDSVKLIDLIDGEYLSYCKENGLDTPGKNPISR